MGDEIEYIIEDFIICDECQNEIRFVIRGYEYPVGAYNYDDYEIFGGDFIQEPNMGIIYFQEVGDLLDTVEYDYPKFHLLMDCFWCKLQSDHVELNEHEDARWLSREELDSVDWLPADITLVERIGQNI